MLSRGQPCTRLSFFGNCPKRGTYFFWKLSQEGNVLFWEIVPRGERIFGAQENGFYVLSRVSAYEKLAIGGKVW